MSPSQKTGVEIPSTDTPIRRWSRMLPGLSAARIPAGSPTATAIRVRPARTDDAPSLVDYNCRLAEESEGKALDRARVEPGVHALLADPHKGRYFVAEIDDVLAGQAMYTTEWSDWRDGEFWWIQSVYVAPEHRGKGVFTRLYRHVEAEARRREDISGLRLYVEAHNERARAIYAHLGMRRAPYEMLEVDFVLGEKR
jgi:GNAT superfamily N-acetyltransferase